MKKQQKVKNSTEDMVVNYRRTCQTGATIIDMAMHMFIGVEIVRVGAL